MLNIIYSAIYLSLPLALLAFFVISLVLYCRAKAGNKREPGTYTDDQVRLRLTLLIISACIAGIMLLCVVGLIALMFMAVAYM